MKPLPFRPTFLVLTFIASPLAADTVLLKNGRKIYGKVSDARSNETVLVLEIDGQGSATLARGRVESIEKNPTGRPVIAQMIGNDIPSLARTAKELQQLPIVAVDLNLGCPAPIVYRKCAGGGLLREPQRVDAILGALRDAVSLKFTVKTRLGFDSPAVFDELLPIFAKHRIDLLTVHGRTVAEG